MNGKEIFDSAVRSRGDRAGVFEHDGDAGYFYLYNVDGIENKKIIATIKVSIGRPDFDEKDVLIRWDMAENIVGLFIRTKLWAAFDVFTGAKYGGNYRPEAQPMIPAAVTKMFEL